MVNLYRNILLAGFAALLLLGCGSGGIEPAGPDTIAPPQKDTIDARGATLVGKVLADGKPLPGAVVSDGKAVVVTDTAGIYRISSDKHCGYVFVSLPSGYEAARDGILPKFWAFCESPAGAVERHDFPLVKVDQSEYTMLFFGDMHLAARSFCHDIDQFRSFADEVRSFVAASSKPVYALTLGDMSWDYFWTANNFDLRSYLAEAQRDFGDDLPVFHTMGNHDNDASFQGDEGGQSTYRSVLGPNWYSFNIGSVHYIALDDILYRNTPLGERNFYSEISDEQLDWLARDLSHVSRNNPVVVTMHSPLYRKDGSSALYNLWDMVKLFDGFREVRVVTGHTHIVYNVDRLSSSVHVYENNSGAVCGAWWMTGSNYPGLHISGDGAPGGYRVMDVSGSGFTTRFKGTGCADDYQMRIYDRNGIDLSKYCSKSEFKTTAADYIGTRTDNKVLINVWDWDPSWKISVTTETGQSLQATQLKDVYDPLYLTAYEAYEYSHNYSISYSAYTTDHMFSITAPDADTDITVTLTDRYGRTYSRTVERPQQFEIKY